MLNASNGCDNRSQMLYLCGGMNNATKGPKKRGCVCATEPDEAIRVFVLLRLPEKSGQNRPEARNISSHCFLHCVYDAYASFNRFVLGWLFFLAQVAKISSIPHIR